MKDRPISDYMPDFYQSFFPVEFKTTISDETAATCADCAMWADQDTINTTQWITFSKESKCCTHYPNLPNYLIGALLEDESPELKTGKSRLLSELSRRVGTLPHGLFRPRKFAFLIRHSPDSFGRSNMLICPFYERDDGVCTLWPYRNGVCGTWFCKYIDGEDGRLFWLSLRKFLVHVEECLSWHIMMKAGWPADTILYKQSHDAMLTSEDMDEKPIKPCLYKKLWHEYAGREEEWYRNSCRIMEDITPDKFLSIIGVTGRTLMDSVLSKQRVILAESIPGTLKRNPKLKVIDISNDSYTLAGYSAFDPVTLTKRMYRLLDSFNENQTTDEIIEQLIAQGMPVPADDVLISLYRYRFLTDSSLEKEGHDVTDKN